MMGDSSATPAAAAAAPPPPFFTLTRHNTDATPSSARNQTSALVVQPTAIALAGRGSVTKEYVSERTEGTKISGRLLQSNAGPTQQPTVTAAATFPPLTPASVFGRISRPPILGKNKMKQKKKKKRRLRSGKKVGTHTESVKISFVGCLFFFTAGNDLNLNLKREK
jgi:hypothetical protein